MVLPKVEPTTGFYPGLHIRGECKQEPGGGVTHGYTRNLLAYLLTYLNAAVYI